VVPRKQASLFVEDDALGAINSRAKRTRRLPSICVEDGAIGPSSERNHNARGNELDLAMKKITAVPEPGALNFALESSLLQTEYRIGKESDVLAVRCAGQANAYSRVCEEFDQ
jgi:hypothetical protein